MPDDFALPPGMGFRRLAAPELAERRAAAPFDSDLLDVLLVFEPPRRRPQHRDFRYILSADIGDGLGLDRSVATVSRVPTLEEPGEEVAQFVTDTIPPAEFAKILDAVGRFYLDADGIEALAAIECNNHGLSTQDVLQLHLGYTQFYRWEYYDAANPEKRFTTKIGWQTTTRTRPLLLAAFHAALVTLDPITQKPDYVLNSPWTIDELAHFQTETELAEAEAARGKHDDCLLSAAIGHYIGYRLAAGETEPLADRRRRRHEEQAAREEALTRAASPRDFRNTAMTADEVAAGLGTDDYDEFALDGGWY